MLRGSPHLVPMAFLVAGTLQVASQMADAQESLERKVGGPAWPAHSWFPAEPHPSPTLALPPQGKYSVRGLRVALTLSSPEVSASTVAVLDGVFRALGFESCRRREASVQVSPRLLPMLAPSLPGASRCSGPASALAPGLPWGAGWVPGAATCPQRPCGLRSSGRGGSQGAAEAATAAGP